MVAVAVGGLFVQMYLIKKEDSSTKSERKKYLGIDDDNGGLLDGQTTKGP